jgi:hypothetical protein
MRTDYTAARVHERGIALLEDAAEQSGHRGRARRRPSICCAVRGGTGEDAEGLVLGGRSPV